MVAIYAIRSDYAELGHLEEFQSHKCWVKLLSFVHAVGDLNCSIIEPSFFQPEVMTIVTDPLWFSSLNSHKKRAAKLHTHKAIFPYKTTTQLPLPAMDINFKCPTSWKGMPYQLEGNALPVGRDRKLPPFHLRPKNHLHASRRWWSSWRTWQVPWIEIFLFVKTLWVKTPPCNSGKWRFALAPS